MPSVARAEILALLAGARPQPAPAFSGLIHVTAAGLSAAGLRLAEVHPDPARLAQAAASTAALTGWPSAALPLDMCVEAEALGAGVDFYGDDPLPRLPQVSRPLAEAVAGLVVPVPADFERRGRLPALAEAIRQLRGRAGADLVVGAWVPGPFSLLSILTPPNALYLALGEQPASLAPALAACAEALARSAALYQAAGADFITIHEMGGSPGVIGPRAFRRHVLPPLQALVRALRGPRVLSVCGRLNAAALPLLAEAGAEALSVDQLTDLAQARAALGPERLLFGNLDPVAVLAEGDEAAVRASAAAARAAGVDAVWPGCDLLPATPPANLRALVG
ncbi:MAG: hypothetical protein JNK29_17990 [Anaerolineales bacterium]|nr:hypothetical protein [Anaerolineales bacterium]